MVVLGGGLTLVLQGGVHVDGQAQGGDPDPDFRIRIKTTLKTGLVC